MCNCNLLGLQGSSQTESQAGQFISEDGESLIVAADSFVGGNSIEEMETQVCLIHNIICTIAIWKCEVTKKERHLPDTCLQTTGECKET